MADNLTKEQRRKNMQAIRSESVLENVVSRELWKRGVRFRKNVGTLYGKPDIAIKKYKLVVFIDSCFWHGCPIHGNRPLSNQEYWDKKLQWNKERDKEVTQHYKDNNWLIIRIWEHELKNDFEKSIQTIIDFIDSAKEKFGEYT